MNQEIVGNCKCQRCGYIATIYKDSDVEGPPVEKAICHNLNCLFTWIMR